MNNLSRFNFNSTEIRVTFENNQFWWVATDVCSALEILNPSDALKRLDEDEKGIETFKTNGGNQRLLCVNEKGLKAIVCKSRKPAAKRLATMLGIEVFKSSIEADCIGILSSAFQDLNPILQFSVANYRIDLYLSKVNIAIECDENGHKHYSSKQELKRQTDIINLINCTFIRFNPNKQGFNIGDVIFNVRNLIK
ncbi:BRO family protein [Planktothrix agardhii]|uniref:BRO family protein n=1 Tax=Planktothrix agardhii TaxID=1160 RepID=UPI00040122A1|nr:BRO family protein [Planktothrix agardhii]